MSVLNRIENDAAYKSTYPEMLGKNGTLAVHELHVFLQELNPTEERLQQYYTAVREWNDQHPDLNDKMKACF